MGKGWMGSQEGADRKKGKPWGRKAAIDKEAVLAGSGSGRWANRFPGK